MSGRHLGRSVARTRVSSFATPRNVTRTSLGSSSLLRAAYSSRPRFVTRTRSESKSTNQTLRYSAVHPSLANQQLPLRQASTSAQQWQAPQIGDRPVAVLGGGVLGRRIATTWVAAGFDTILVDLSEAQRNAASHYLEHNLDHYNKQWSQVTGGKSDPGSYKVVPDLESAVSNAWLVIEALPEKLELKIDMMGQLDRLAPHDCIIGSNSSSYKSRFMLDKVDPSRRHRILNSHYYMPPDNQTVELMTCGETQKDVLDFLNAKMEQAGMQPAVARKESTGFIFNRLWAAIKRETLLILAEGVSEPKEIDRLFLTMFKNNPAGPCAMMDAVGLDTVSNIEYNYIHERHIDATSRDYVQRNFVDQGKLGAKSGKGGLYPPGATTKSSSDEKGHHDNLAAPRLYFLDIGLGGNVDLHHLSTSGKVMTASADGSHVREIVSGQAAPDGIDVSIEAGKIFWTNMGATPAGNNGSVMSANLDGSNVQPVINVGDIHTPKQIKIDHKANKLYICDREGLRVHRCDFDGSNHEVIVQTGNADDPADGTDQTKWCVGIAVDHDQGKFYWTQKGPSKAGKGRIFRANIDMASGESPDKRSDIELLFDKLPEPIDLEIEEGKLYWTDRGEYPLGNTLNCADVSGSGKPDGKFKTLARHFHEAIGLKIDHLNQHVYMTDLGGTVYRMNLDGSERRKVYETENAYSGIGLAYLH
ncbi:hypothetical protein B9Z65_6977 [Elsinoe australis]|uniref:Uncharacterized protein n=1 Tax=Elsinoe australis TaxID=40998 RepID=A0A2P7Z493_9PEZI|nr:hypothetical protein B9Z65_6977 [Elsinoe australis]